MLLDRGANIEATNTDGVTALAAVAAGAAVAVVELLLQRGANIHAADKYGVTVLMRAARTRSFSRQRHAAVMKRERMRGRAVWLRVRVSQGGTKLGQ